jgi:RHS repeat-associated protein
MQTDTSQNSVATRTYDAFGNVLASTGTWNGPFGYAGGFGYQEDRSGLMLLGHRYYDSSTGRFLTPDRAKDDRNWYMYGGGSGDPLNTADPFGLARAKIYDIGRRVWYMIWKDKDELERAYRRSPGHKDKRFDPRDKGRPEHAHYPDKNGENMDVHHTWEAEADQAVSKDWKGGKWRRKSVDLPDKDNPFLNLGLLLLAIRLREPISAGLALGELVDPYAEEAGSGYHGWSYGGRAGIAPDELWGDIY